MGVQVPKKVKYLIVGAGVHGLSTGWHLARELKARGRGTADDIVIVDKTGIGAGASGIACGVVRNSYSQPAMCNLMSASVEIWESDAEALHYSGVGYMFVVGDVQAADVEEAYHRQQLANYRSSLISGEQQVFDYMKQMFPDWKARGLTRCLYEHRGGFALNAASVTGLAEKAEAEGVRILPGVEVAGFQRNGDGSVTRVDTSGGPIEVEQVIIGAGPWIKNLWSKLDLPLKIDIRNRDGSVHKDRDMWTYWHVREGDVEVGGDVHVTADGKTPPVVHVDSTEPLISDKTGSLVTDGLWGIYWKRGKRGVQGGGVPLKMGLEAEVDPYGPESPHYQVGDEFADYLTSGLAHCIKRFEGCSRSYLKKPSGGIGSFSADHFPVFDYMLPNVYIIADSNHGYKMLAVGKEVAKVLMGEHSSILHPFRFARFAEGDLHPVSSSPFPWS